MSAFTSKKQSPEVKLINGSQYDYIRLYSINILDHQRKLLKTLPLLYVHFIIVWIV
jgi:hypothetical protein